MSRKFAEDNGYSVELVAKAGLFLTDFEDTPYKVQCNALLCHVSPDMDISKYIHNFFFFN